MTARHPRPTGARPKPRTIPKLIWSEDYWMLRAEQAHAYVSRQTHAECGRILREIAASYAHLAELTSDYWEAAKAAGRRPTLK